MKASMTRRLSGALLALGLVVGAPAQAAPITFEFTGEVTFSDFAPAIPVRSAVTGSYTFDDGLIDTDADDFIGRYGPVDLVITFVDGSSLSTSTAAFLIINNSSGIGSTDEYIVDIFTPVILAGSFASLELHAGRLHRSDPKGEAVVNDFLLLEPPVLNSLPVDQSLLAFGDDWITFTLTSLTVALCGPTALGEVVDARGCSIAQLCPCDGAWKNPGAYGSCVSKAADDFQKLGLIAGSEKGAITSAAGQSSCGKPEKGEKKDEK